MTGQVCSNCGTDLADKARFCSHCGSAVGPSRVRTVERLRDALGVNYEIMGELGRGGFSIVYLVGDQLSRRYLAVKVMRPELMASQVAVERFRREIRYVAKLRHPNILPVMFAAEKADLAYYAMPRVRGRALNEIFRDGRVATIEEAMRILSDVASGLAYAHRNGVIHRDVKPSNIMVEKTGRSLLVDFGVAKGLAAEAGSLTTSGEIIGSPQYMSPEQVAAEERIDRRTDIYSWGVVGYELLVGQPPFAGRTAQEIVYNQRNQTPPDLRAVVPDAPDALIDTIKRSMERDPPNRWQSMEEVLRQLQSGAQAVGR
jgi:serine/threonine-protein kinase